MFFQQLLPVGNRIHGLFSTHADFAQRLTTERCATVTTAAATTAGYSQPTFDLYLAFEGDTPRIDDDCTGRALHNEALVGLDLVHTGLLADFFSGLQFNPSTHPAFQVTTDGLLEVGRDLFVFVIADADDFVFADLALLVSPNLMALIVSYRDFFVMFHALSAVMADADALIMADVLCPVMAHLSGLVVVDHVVLVFLRMDEDLFFLFLIFKPQFVIPLTLMGAGFQGHARFVPRQFVGRRVDRVVGAPGDDRLVRIAFQEVDDHFVADARDRHLAPGAAGPVLRDPDPAAREVVAFAVAVPGKLDFYPAPFVAVDLFARRTDDLGHLRAVHHWL